MSEQEIKHIIKRLNHQLGIVEKHLSKNRTTVIEDGWQTQRHSKKSRNWDLLAQTKIELLGKISDYENQLKFVK